MLRIINEIKPKYIVTENVENILRTNNGRDFRTILRELDGMGYNAEWRVCRASEVGAPHHRSRLYVVAYPNSIRIQGSKSFFSLLQEPVKQECRKITGTDVEINVGGRWLGKSPVYFLDDGVSADMDILAESIKAAGNAIVPQIALQIFKSINEYENQ